MIVTTTNYAAYFWGRLLYSRAYTDGARYNIIDMVVLIIVLIYCDTWQELSSAWEKIAQMADINRQVLAASSDIKAQLQPFYKIIDESSQLSSNTHNRYYLFYSLTYTAQHNTTSPKCDRKLEKPSELERVRTSPAPFHLAFRRLKEDGVQRQTWEVETVVTGRKTKPYRFDWVIYSRWYEASRLFHWRHISSLLMGDVLVATGHRWKLAKAHSRCDARLYFFSVRVLNRWNSLPQRAVEVSSVNSLKSYLEKIRHTQMDFFMDN